MSRPGCSSWSTTASARPPLLGTWLVARLRPDVRVRTPVTSYPGWRRTTAFVVPGRADGRERRRAASVAGAGQELVREARDVACPRSASAWGHQAGRGRPRGAGRRDPTVSRSGCSASAGPTRPRRTGCSSRCRGRARAVQWNDDVVDELPATRCCLPATTARRGPGGPVRPAGVGRPAAPEVDAGARAWADSDRGSHETAASTPTRCCATSTRPAPSSTRPGAPGHRVRGLVGRTPGDDAADEPR